MPIPTAPTLDKIIEEALKAAGYEDPLLLDPSSSLSVRAKTEWMMLVKNEIQLYQSHHNDLKTDKIIVLKVGKRRYDLVSLIPDFESSYNYYLLNGDESDRGLVVSASNTSIQIDPSDARSGFERVGREIVILNGVAEGQVTTGLVFDENTKTFTTIDPQLAVVPNPGDKYLIDTNKTIFMKDPLDQLEDYWPSKERFDIVGEELMINFIPDTEYALRIFYYANLNMIDTDSLLMGRLYRKWFSVFVAGIKAKAMADKDEERALQAENDFAGLVKGLSMKTSIGGTISSRSDL